MEQGRIASSLRPQQIVLKHVMREVAIEKNCLVNHIAALNTAHCPQPESALVVPNIQLHAVVID